MDSQSERRQKGQYGEQVAARFLCQQGLLFLEKNYQTRFGEIDLIFYDPQYKELVFVEVKLRKNQQYGGTIASITPKKCQRLVKAAELYLATYIEQNNSQIPACRFDVVLLTEKKQTGQIEYMCEWCRNIELF